jgi:hypothetical protein
MTPSFGAPFWAKFWFLKRMSSVTSSPNQSGGSNSSLFSREGKLDFGKHQTFQISPKYVELDFLASLVDLVTDFLNPSTFGAQPKRIKLIGTQFDFQFPALQTPAALKSLEIALADFSQPYLRAGDIDREVTLDDIFARVLLKIFWELPHFKNSLDFVAAFMLGHAGPPLSAIVFSIL